MFAASKSGRRAVAATDPFFPYVPLLLETTTTNGQQNNTFLDSSTNNYTLTRSGTPTQGSVTPYWPNGYWSNYFSGSAADYLSTPNSANLVLGSSNYTIEFWVFATASASPLAMISKGNTSSLGTEFWSVEFSNTTGGFSVYVGAYSSGSAILTGTLTLSAWNHVAVVRNGLVHNLYVNGTSVSNITVGSSYTVASGGNLYIGTGWYTPSTRVLFGYISNARIVIGTAVYTSNFTPSTTPLTAITNTQLLTCQSNRFVDNSANAFVLTPNTLPKVQAFQPFSPAASYTTALYGGSIYNGTKTDTLTATSTAAITTFTGDFTIESWVYPTDTNFGGTWGILDTRTSGSTAAAWVWGITSYSSGWNPQFYNSSGSVTTFSARVQANTWTHLVLQRNGSTVRCFVNGVVDATTGTVSGTITGGSSTVFIANTKDNGISGYGNLGYTSNLRIVNGTAVYTTTGFTPPTAPVTAITNTSLLVNATNAGIYDAAVQNNEVTVGSAQASTTQFKWSPTSMKFNGTTDYLTTIDGPQLQLGTGDFTIDGWVYLSATGVAYGIISKGTATTGWSVNVTALNKLQFSYTASNLTGTTSLATGTWYYFAVVRSGSATGNLKVYLNGTVDATSGGAVTDAFTQTNTLYVGADRVGMSLLSGYLQDVRITKYARTITTPTAAFPTR